jgi:hypothetical protein
MCIAVFACVTSEAQYRSDGDLARALADPDNRAAAVSYVVASGAAKIPLLLSWTISPPPGIDGFELKLGLADAFGRAKTAEAVPFLVRNISIDRTGAVNTWLKSPQAVQQRLAAANALIEIGPAAADALFHAWPGMAEPRDRLATIFVISRLGDIPGARNFLVMALGEANLQRSWAEMGLAGLPK